MLTPSDFRAIQAALKHDVLRWQLTKLEAMLKWLKENKEQGK